MASLAGRGKARLPMWRIACLIEVRQVATHAGSRRSYEFSAYVASRTIEGSVRPGQGEPGELEMVELRAHPVVHRVALLATGRQVQFHVVQAGCLGINKISLMAGVTGRRQALELSHSGILVAGIAIHGGMRANQRKAVNVLVDLLNRDIPALDRVALLAVGAHLPLVNVGVAVRALRSHIREHQLGVALGTGHALVHSAQRVLGRVVIEFRNSADRLPTAESVAVLAGNAKASVRAPRVRGGLHLSTCQFPARQNR